MADQPQVTNVKCCFCQKTFPFDFAKGKGGKGNRHRPIIIVVVNPLEQKVLRGQDEVEGAAVTQQFYYSG